MKDVGPMMERYLKHIRMDQKALAVAIGISPQTMGVLLKSDATRWKLSNFEKACKVLNLHPGIFFDEGPMQGNSIMGDVANSSVYGNPSIIMGNNEGGAISEILNQLQLRISDKESQIADLREVIAVQKQLIENLKKN